MIKILTLAIAFLLSWRAMSQTALPNGKVDTRTQWLELEIGIIGVASEDILRQALAEARASRYAGLLIKLDTPGGGLQATRNMVKDILASDKPILVWVGPAGAHAGSAGAFIALSAHIVSMAPGTQIGAAHPIEADGSDIEGDLRTKVENDAVAFMESIATIRGRNREPAVAFVTSSVSLTAEDALKQRVIDMINPDTQSFMQALDGKAVVLAGGKTLSLSTSQVELIAFELSWRQQLLTYLSDPNLFYLLLMAGLLGVALEFIHPGSLFPGVLGAISLILALIAAAVLPISFGAVLLIIASIAFMVAEIFLPSFGVLGVGGIIGFLTGSILLIDRASSFGLSISWLTILPSALILVTLLSVVGYLVLKNQISQVQTGREALQGMEAEAAEDFVMGKGFVRLQGELWSAEVVTHLQVNQGDRLLVEDSKGLLLRVKSIST